MSTGRHDSSSTTPYRLLGIMKKEVGLFGLLGVSPENCDRAAVMRALRNQLARLDRHPESGSEEADHLRRELQRAADELLIPESREAARRAFYGHDASDIPVDNTGHDVTRKQDEPILHEVSSTSNPVEDTGQSYPVSTTVKNSDHSQSEEFRTRRAEALLNSAVNTTSAIPTRTTTDPIDDAIAMAIASSGGWNALARCRIAAVAMQHGVAPDDLTEKILQSVRLVGIESIESWHHPAVEGASARSTPGSARAGVDQTREGAGRSRRPLHVPTIEPGKTPTAVPQRKADQEEISEEDEAHRAAMRTMTAALVTFFIALILIIPFGIYILYQINSGNAVESSVTQMDGEEGVSGENNRVASERTSPRNRAEVPKQTMPITFSAALDEVEQDLHGREGLPDDVIQKYQILIDQVRHAWVRFDDKSLERIRAFVVSSLYEKGMDVDASRAIIQAVDPESSSQDWDAESVQGRVWSDAMLISLSAESGLPAVARRELEIHRRRRTSGRVTSESSGSIPFRNAAMQSLESMIEPMARGGALGGAWVKWVEAIRSLNLSQDERDDLILQAIYQLVIHTSSMASENGARTAVLVLMDVISWNHTEEGRRTVLAWFDDPRVHADALSVITGYLVMNGSIPGLDASFVLAEDAGSRERAALRTHLASIWKPTGRSGSSGAADAEADVRNWLAHAENALQATLPDDDEKSLGLLLQTARLNTAAALFEAMDIAEARKIINSTDLDLLDAQITAELDALKGASTTSTNTNQSAMDTNDDGEFAFAYAAAVKNNDKEGREGLLEDLLHGRARDLGEVDSAMLVRLAYQGTPRAIRALAQQVIADQFAGGPTVLLRLADTMSPDEPNAGISQVIEKVTAHILPDVKSNLWYAEARFALLQHILELTGVPAASARVDAVAALIAQSYARRAGMDSQTVQTITDPADAAQRCFDRWMSRARPMQPVQPVPGTLSDIQRRRETRLYFQDDPIGVFAVNQIGVLETTVYVTAAERPGLRDELMTILNEAEERRAESATAIHQLIELERAILRVQVLRVGMAWGINTK